MAKPCPLLGTAIYLDCLDCDDKQCQKSNINRKELIAMFKHENIIHYKNNLYHNFRCIYEIKEKNNKGESISIEFTRIFAKDNEILELWKKSNKLVHPIKEGYWYISVYVTNKDGECYSKYNPFIKNEYTKTRIKKEEFRTQIHSSVNFEKVMESTKRNKKKLMNEILNLFYDTNKEYTYEKI